MSAPDWTELDMGKPLPTGTVTLLLGDVEGSTQLWESQPEAMTAAIALMNRTAGELIAQCGGVRPIEQGEGDSFVSAFNRASDAAACAVALQRTWPPSGCGWACTPGRYSCATRGTTRGRRSTRRPDCAIWRTAARP